MTSLKEVGHGANTKTSGNMAGSSSGGGQTPLSAVRTNAAAGRGSKEEAVEEAEDTDDDVDAEDSWLTGKHLLPEDDAAGLQVLG